MLIQLPLEVWMEILEWLRGYRRKLAAKCNQLGDRTFVSEICMPWLHEYSKNVQLGSLYIKTEKAMNNGLPEKRGCLKVKIGDEKYKAPFAQVPMPANITGFVALHISYLDATVLAFLRLMPFWTNNNSKIRLNIEVICNLHSQEEKEEQMRTALGHFQGLLSSGIEAVLFNWITTLIFPSILQRCSDLIFSAKLLVFDYGYSHYNDGIIRWLGTERADGEPRMAVLYRMWPSIIADLIDYIRKQFMASTTPISFFVAIYSYPDPDDINETSVKNDITGEQLIMRRAESQTDLLIGRCPATADGDGWLQQMEQKAAMPEEALPSWTYICEYDSPPMFVSLSTPQIGPMKSEVGEEENRDNHDEQQPGPSGLKRKQQQGRQESPCISLCEPQLGQMESTEVVEEEYGGDNNNNDDDDVNDDDAPGPSNKRRKLV